MNRAKHHHLSVPLFLALAVAVGFLGSPILAQSDRADTSAADAGKELEAMTDQLLRDYVAQNKKLSAASIGDLQGALEKLEKYMRRFDKDQRAHFYLLDAFVSHYAGDATAALEKVEKAYKTQPTNADVADGAVTLALCHRRFDLAHKVLNKRHAGAAVRVKLGLPTESFTDTLSQKSHELEPVEPNAPATTTTTLQLDPNSTGTGANESGLGAAEQEPSSAPRPFQNRLPGDAESGPKKPADAEARPASRPASRPKSSGRPPYGGKSSSSSGKGILNLPIDFMPPETLGVRVPDLDLRTINGSYYHFGVSSGQILCMFTWALDEEAESPSSRSRRRGYSSRDADKIPAPAADLETNLEQFRDLFRPYFLTGKSSFLAVNLNPGNRISEVITRLSEDPFPWVNCMFADDLNSEQLLPFVQAQPIITIVGVDSEILYVGPVGGYLPRMIFDQELGQARFGIPGPSSVDSIRSQLPAARRSTPAGPRSGGLLNTLFGGGGQTPPPEATTPPETTPPPKTSADRRKLDPIAIDRAKRSDDNAKRLLQLAAVKRRTGSYYGALTQYDLILERYPDTVEAEQAKVLIKSIVTGSPRLEQDRKAQGKYPYDE